MQVSTAENTTRQEVLFDLGRKLTVLTDLLDTNGSMSKVTA